MCSSAYPVATPGRVRAVANAAGQPLMRVRVSQPVGCRHGQQRQPRWTRPLASLLSGNTEVAPKGWKSPCSLILWLCYSTKPGSSSLKLQARSTANGWKHWVVLLVSVWNRNILQTLCRAKLCISRPARCQRSTSFDSRRWAAQLCCFPISKRFDIGKLDKLPKKRNVAKQNFPVESVSVDLEESCSIGNYTFTQVPKNAK